MIRTSVKRQFLKFFVITAMLTESLCDLHGQVVTYEGWNHPLEEGWSVGQIVCNPVEYLEDGWLVHEVDLCDGFPPPGGQRISYKRSLSDYMGLGPLFWQFRLVTDGPSTEFSGVAPCSLSLGSFCDVNYLFVISADKAKLNRDNLLPIPIIDIAPDVPHTYRLELYSDQQYTWTIDGQIVDAGVPEGVYPCLVPEINFRTKANNVPNTTSWDYIRYGVIPQAHSGDFDSSGLVDYDDLYFFCDCLLGPDYDAVGPGCVWADLNSDGVADGRDVSDFAAAMIGP